MGNRGHGDGGLRGHRSSKAGLVAGGMLLMLVALVGGSTALGSRDEQGPSREGFGRASGPVSTTTTTTLEPLVIPSPPHPRGGPPSELVAVTPEGAIVVVDVATGRVTRRLAHPEKVEDYAFIEALTVSPDGWVWFTWCCELALLRVPLDGSTAEECCGLARHAVVAPGGRHLAALSFPGAVVADLSRWDPSAWRPERDLLTPEDSRELAWSLDGRTFVVRTGREDVGPLFAIDAGQLTSNPSNASDLAETTRLPGESWTLPVFRRDGRLVAADRSSDGRWAGRVIDVRTRELRVDETFSYGGRPLSQAFDATGEWLLTVVSAGDAGRLAWRGPDGSSGTVPGRYVLAAW